MLTKSLEEVIFEEVTLRVCRMHSPEVVCNDVEDAQHNDKESSRPLGLEANRNHNTGNQADYGNENAADAPGTLDNESEEEENEQNAPSKEEAEINMDRQPSTQNQIKLNVLFLPVGLADAG